jgi:FkbM family methyltransferase
MLAHKNLALNRQATQSSTCRWSKSELPEQDARSGNNGKTNIKDTFHTGWEKDPWWQVDLGDLYAVERVNLFNRVTAKERLKQFSIVTSVDGKDWSSAFSKRNDEVFEQLDVTLDPVPVARYVRVRLDGVGCLHFRECEVFGRSLSEDEREPLLAQDATLRKSRTALPKGRQGHLSSAGGFDVFVDTKQYYSEICSAIDQGFYEARERGLVRKLVKPGDKVLEIGTAIGVVTMTAASIVGAENVFTFDANPDIVADAKLNFERNNLGEIDANVGILRNRADFREGEQAAFYVSKAFWRSRLDAKPHEKDIVKTVHIPVYCLENELKRSGATVLICDIEGGEADLLTEADLSGIRLMIMETHYWAVGAPAIDKMIGRLIGAGLSMDLVHSKDQVVVLRRHPD